MTAHCTARMLLLSEKLSCCAAGTNGCLDLKRRASALGERVSVSGEGAQAPWHGVLEIVWLYCDEAQQVGWLRELEGCPLV